jgi:hypothetical protein
MRIVAVCILVALLSILSLTLDFPSLLACAADIVKYLFKEYGAGRQPSPGLLER